MERNVATGKRNERELVKGERGKKEGACQPCSAILIYHHSRGFLSRRSVLSIYYQPLGRQCMHVASSY